VAAEFHPDLVVVKENEGHLRGREQGEVPRIIRAALLRAGMPESALPMRMTEVDAHVAPWNGHVPGTCSHCWYIRLLRAPRVGIAGRPGRRQLAPPMGRPAVVVAQDQ